MKRIGRQCEARLRAMVKIALFSVLLGGMAPAQNGPQNVQRRPATLNEPTPTLRVNVGSAGVEANGPSDVSAVALPEVLQTTGQLRMAVLDHPRFGLEALIPREIQGSFPNLRSQGKINAFQCDAAPDRSIM